MSQLACLTELETLTNTLTSWRAQHKTWGLVATMGNLHDGHISLVNQIAEQVDHVIVSIFVNPTQFGPNEDFANYPRSLAQDQQKLANTACNVIFAPAVTMMYQDSLCSVSVIGISDELCGKSRPGHFDGVATVVSSLLNLTQPHVAIFGEKDYQQLLVIKSLVKDLHFPTQIISAPIYREADGLAMSSRNNYLDAQQRPIAAKLHIVLNELKQNWQNKHAKITELEKHATNQLKQLGFKVDYLSIRNRHDLSLANESNRNQLIALAAAYLGNTRLIDNLYL